MSELASALFGVNEQTLLSLRSGKTSSSLGGTSQSKSDFAAKLEELLADYRSLGVSSSDEESDSSGISLMETDSVQKTSLEQLYIESMLSRLESSEECSDIVDETDTEDLLNTSSTEEAVQTGEISSVLDESSSRTAKDIVLATGSENQELIDKINAASSLEERLQYVEELKDKIIEALQEDGINAHDSGKADKISIDGELVDVIRASRRMGRDAGIQYLEVAASTEENSLSEAIWQAGEASQDLLTELSSSSDSSTRQSLAMDFRDEVISNLVEKGYTAQAGESADKIIVNGETYDIIRSLNALDSQAMFQVLKA